MKEKIINCYSNSSSLIKEEERRRNCTFDRVSLISYPIRRMNTEGLEHKLFYQSAMRTSELAHSVEKGCVFPHRKRSVENLFSFLDQSSVKQQLALPYKGIWQDIPQPEITDTTMVEMYCPNPKCGFMQYYNPKQRNAHDCSKCGGKERFADNNSEGSAHDETTNSGTDGFTGLFNERHYELEMFPEDGFPFRQMDEGVELSHMVQFFEEGKYLPDEILNPLEGSLDEQKAWIKRQNVIRKVTIPSHEMIGEFGMVRLHKDRRRCKWCSWSWSPRSVGKLLTSLPKGDERINPVAGIDKSPLGKKIDGRKFGVFGSQKKPNSDAVWLQEFEVGEIGDPWDYNPKFGHPLQEGRFKFPTVGTTYLEFDNNEYDTEPEYLDQMVNVCPSKHDGDKFNCDIPHFHNNIVKWQSMNPVPEWYWEMRELAMKNKEAKDERKMNHSYPEEDLKWIKIYGKKYCGDLSKFDLRRLSEQDIKDMGWGFNETARKKKDNFNPELLQRTISKFIRLCGIIASTSENEESVDFPCSQESEDDEGIDRSAQQLLNDL